MATGPFFSVIVPTYQRRATVLEAIESVLAQLFRDFELIVVDDGSTDGTANALEGYGNRIRYLRQANGGAAAARNAALEQARGEVIAFLDSDNRWLPEHLAVVADVLHEFPEAVLASTLPTSRLRPSGGAPAPRLVEPLPRLFLGNFLASSSAVAVRREVMVAAGGFDERLRLAEDADLWLRIALGGGRFAYAPRRTVTTRVLEDSLFSSRTRGEYAASLEASTTRALEQLDGVGAQFAGELRGRLHLVRALGALDGSDAQAVRRELQIACRLLPELLSSPERLLRHVGFSVPDGDGLVEHARRLALVYRAWPGSRARLRVAVRSHVLIALRPWNGDGQRAAAERLRSIMIRTERGPLRVLWRLAHEALARAVARHVRDGDDSVSVYVRGSLGTPDAVYGLSDVDLAFVTAFEDAPSPTRRAINRRSRHLRRRLPTAFPGLLEPPEVYGEKELWTRREASSFSHGRRSGAVPVSSRERPRERAGAERSLVPGLMRDWRLIAGPERRSECPPQDAAERRLTAWLELQYWWLQAFRMCSEPRPFDAPYKCVKLMTEPARIWLWLSSGERFDDRRVLIARARSALPSESEALHTARGLLDSLGRSPEAPVERALESCVRVSQQIERQIAADLAPAGTTRVRLRWGEPRELVVSEAAVAGSHRAVAPHRTDAPLPLVDWRARVWSLPPDECFSCLDAVGPDPRLIGSAAIDAHRGAYAALRLDRLLLLPSVRQARLRGVQCTASDPVSFALMEEADHAHFPDVPGWSANDSARRAASEHLAWLRSRRNHDPVEELGRLFTAARASLFLESVERGGPELPLTVRATAEQLGDAAEGPAALAQEAWAAYRAGRVERKRPPDHVVTSLRALVEGLPGYEGRCCRT